MSKKVHKLAVKDKSGSGGEMVETGRHPFFGLRDEMNRLFDEFFSSGSWFTPRGRGGFELKPLERLEGRFSALQPHVDVTQSEKDYRISAELPGLTEDDIELTMGDGILTLKGEKREEAERKKGKDVVISERHYGSFSRSFRLPPDADPSKIEAELVKGVLTITLPKTEGAKKPERIEVKAG